MKPVCHTVISIFNKILWVQLYSLNCNESEFHYWLSVYGWKRLVNAFWASKEVMRVYQKLKAIFKLSGNWDREELAHCAVLTVPVEEFSHAQYSALPSVEWQQWGWKHGRSFVRVHHRRTTWRSAVSLGQKEWNRWKFTVVCWLSMDTAPWVNERFMSGWKGLNWVEHVLLMKVVLVGHQHRAAEKLLLRRNAETSWTI